MISLIHGSNIVISRQQLINLTAIAKQENKEIINLNGLTIDLNQTIQSLESTSLFGQDKFVIIENFFSRPKSKEKNDISKYLKKQNLKPDLILWEKKEIPGTTTRWLPKNWNIKLFKTPASIFKFLDNLTPAYKAQALEIFNNILKKDSVEMTFYMMASRIKELIIAKDLKEKGLKGAPWQKTKLLNQSKNYSLEQLINIYQKMLKTDVDIKTGRSIMPLEWHLDLLIATL